MRKSPGRTVNKHIVKICFRAYPKYMYHIYCKYWATLNPYPAFPKIKKKSIVLPQPVMSQRTTKYTIHNCATSKDSDQPSHLISVFADRMCLLQPPGYLKRDTRELLPYCVGVQVDLSLSWLVRSYCRFCSAPVYMSRKCWAKLFKASLAYRAR